MQGIAAATPEEKREQTRERNRRNYQRHKVAHNARSLAWKRSHPESVRESNRKQYYKNLEKRREYQREYERGRLKPPEWKAQRAAYLRQYRAEHSERLKEYDRTRNPQRNAYRRTHPEIDRLKRQRRRARLAEVESTLTLDQWKAIQAAYKERCAYCNKRSSNLTVDHVVALASGGPHIASNIVPACFSCNSTKGPRPPLNLPAVRLML